MHLRKELWAAQGVSEWLEMSKWSDISQTQQRMPSTEETIVCGLFSPPSLPKSYKNKTTMRFVNHMTANIKMSNVDNVFALTSLSNFGRFFWRWHPWGEVWVASMEINFNFGIWVSRCGATSKCIYKQKFSQYYEHILCHKSWPELSPTFLPSFGNNTNSFQISISKVYFSKFIFRSARTS